MDRKVIDFLGKHRISVLTTLLKSGQPHSATLHYAYTPESDEFVFLTEANSVKCTDLAPDTPSPSSLVIGFSEEEWITFQAEGEVTLVQDEGSLDKAWDIYASKYKGADKHKGNQHSVILKFVPKWWRYTEVKPDPMRVISSED